MPKQKRIKNTHKLIGESSSPAISPLDTAFSPAPISPLSQGSSSQASSTQAPSSQAPSPNAYCSQAPSPNASCSQAPSPNASCRQAPFGHRVGRQSNHYWAVDVIDEKGLTKQCKLKVQDVFNLSSEMRIVVNFDEFLSPIGDAAGLLAGVCGQMATDTAAFPISFSSWNIMPPQFFDYSFDYAIKKSVTGQNVSRVTMWDVTHKRKDGRYVNDEAKEIGDKIQEHLTQNASSSSEISPHDAVGAVLGPEHPGRVRGLGLGVVPTQAFRHTTTRLSGINLGSTSGTSGENWQQRMEAKIQALWTFISSQAGVRIPAELVDMFDCPEEQAPPSNPAPADEEIAEPANEEIADNARSDNPTRPAS